MAQNYEAQARQEAKFWGKKFRRYLELGWVPDLRERKKIDWPVPAIWHDPKLDDIARGRERDRIITIAASVKGGRVLELGCGPGWLSLELARHGLRVEGMDISEEAIAIARQSADLNSASPGFGSLAYSVQDLNKVSLKPNHYDVVVAWDSLHHILHLERLMQEVKLALKPKGFLLIFDHIGFQRRNTLLIYFWHTLFSLLPFYTKRSYREKLERIIGRIFGRQNLQPNQKNPREHSPFEDVGQDKIIPNVGGAFLIKELWTLLAFYAVIAPKIGDVVLKYNLARFLKAMDDALIRTGLFRGEYVFIIAEKRD